MLVFVRGSSLRSMVDADGSAEAATRAVSDKSAVAKRSASPRA